jgi:hypothetical protein
MRRCKAVISSSERKIISRILKVRKAGDRAARSKRRFADYRYLRSVLRAYEYFSDNNILEHLTVIAPSELMTAVRAGSHPLRIIIDASSNQPDLQIRSRWTRALEYALTRNVSSDDLPRFIQANGGVAGCADLASKIKLGRRGSEAETRINIPGTQHPSNHSKLRIAR